MTLCQICGIALQLSPCCQKRGEGVEIAPVAVACSMAQQSRRKSPLDCRIAPCILKKSRECCELLQTQVAGSQLELASQAPGFHSACLGVYGTRAANAQEAVANTYSTRWHTDRSSLVFEPDKPVVECDDVEIRVSGAPADRGISELGHERTCANIKADFRDSIRETPYPDYLESTNSRLREFAPCVVVEAHPRPR